MKLKNLTIAIAMASMGVASFAAQAESKTSFYGSARAGIEYIDTDGDTTTTIRNFASRMGFRGETELGNGLTGFGRYEFGVNMDDDDGSAALTQRHAYLGVKGDWGRVFIGNTTHAYFNTVLAPLDQGWWETFLGASHVSADLSRTGEAITAEGKVGMFQATATSYLNDNKFQDGFEVGGSVGVAGVKVGLGMRDTDGTGREIGASVGGKVGAIKYAANYVDRKDADDNKLGNSFDLFAGYGDAYVAYGQAELEANDRKPNGFAIGYSYKLGKQTMSWIEVARTDSDQGTSSDKSTAVRAALKYDF